MPPNIVKWDLVPPQNKPYTYCIADQYVVDNLKMANTKGPKHVVINLCATLCDSIVVF